MHQWLLVQRELEHSFIGTYVAMVLKVAYLNKSVLLKTRINMKARARTTHINDKALKGLMIEYMVLISFPQDHVTITSIWKLGSWIKLLFMLFHLAAKWRVFSCVKCDTEVVDAF